MTFGSFSPTVPKPTWGTYLWFTAMLLCAELIGFCLAAVLLMRDAGFWAHLFSFCAVVFFVLVTWLPSGDYIKVLPTGHKLDEDVVMWTYLIWLAAVIILSMAWLLATFNPWIVSAVLFILGGLFVMIVLASGPEPEVA